MTLAKSDKAPSGFSRPPNSRAALALAHALSDSQTRKEIVPFGASTGSSTLSDIDPQYFTRLLTEPGCKDAWEKYTNVTELTGFPQKLAKGEAPLNGFRHYTLQDAIYLEEYVRVRLNAIVAAGSKVSPDDLLAFASHVQGGIKYSTDTRAVCEYQLGIPEATINTEWDNRSDELNKSIKHYNDVIQAAIDKKDGTSWLDIHFALLPCIKGYYEIAKALLQDPTTIRNTLYYSLWIQANADESYVLEYDDFIEHNIGANPNWELLGKIFKDSCDNEKAFFDLAIKNYEKYDVVSGTKYTIHPYAKKAFSLAPDDQGGVTILATSTQCELTNDKDGYSIKLGDKGLLGYETQNNSINSTGVGSTKWSINPVSIPGYTTYQIFPKDAIQLALDADTKTNKVSVAKDDITTQTWILTEVKV